MPALFLKERFITVAASESHSMSETKKTRGGVLRRNVTDFAHGFAITLKIKPFLKLCIATFLVFNGFIMVAAFQSYVIIYYVFGGDTVAGAEYAGYAGTLGAISTFVVIAVVTALATRIGKRRAFLISTGISMIGYALKWICYTPDAPWLLLLPAPFIAFGLGGLFTLMPSMIADVVDYDELNTRERREGMFGSIFWWVVKLGQAAALAAGGFLLTATGFDVALEGAQPAQTITMIRLFDAFVPCLASGIAIWIIATYTLTEEKAHEVRERLEAIRGAV
jgi:GPH family glycoside/pentoside/hexuronide:cation symporter